MITGKDSGYKRHPQVFVTAQAVVLLKGTLGR